MPRLTTEQRLERAQQQKAEAEAVIRSVAAKLREDDRRADTRRKIIIGGLFLAQAEKRQDVSDWIRSQIDKMPDRDKAAFDGWTVPAPMQAAPTPKRLPPPDKKVANDLGE